MPGSRTEDQWATLAEGQALADFLVARDGQPLARIASALLYLHDPHQDLWRARDRPPPRRRRRTVARPAGRRRRHPTHRSVPRRRVDHPRHHAGLRGPSSWPPPAVSATGSPNAGTNPPTPGTTRPSPTPGGTDMAITVGHCQTSRHRVTPSARRGHRTSPGWAGTCSPPKRRWMPPPRAGSAWPTAPRRGRPPKRSCGTGSVAPGWPTCPTGRPGCRRSPRAAPSPTPTCCANTARSGRPWTPSCMRTRPAAAPPDRS